MTVAKLIKASLARSTRTAYRRYINRFKEFCRTQQPQLSWKPASASSIAKFIAHLFNNHYSPSTIASHLSAIAYSHKIRGLRDPSRDFVVQRMLLGCKKIAKVSDTRLPILLPLLYKLCNTCKHFCSPFDCIMYKALMLITFYGFFRMGELLPHNHTDHHKVVQFHDLVLSKKSATVTLRHYKTKISNKPITIVIRRTGSNLCPVKTLNTYVQRRGLAKGPLFLRCDNSVLYQSVFSRRFRQFLSFLQLPASRYKPHSFRIGACTQAILSGRSEAEVKAMGRWKSHAYKKYIRLPVIKH